MSGDARLAGDRSDIRSLVDRYANAFDVGDLEGFEALWSDDGLLEVFEDGPAKPPTGRLRARTHFHLAFEALSRYRRTLHHVTTHVVTVSGDSASGTTCCEAHHVSVPDGLPPEDLVMHIRYRDRFVRSGGAWRFRHRCVDVLFTEVRALHASH